MLSAVEAEREETNSLSNSTFTPLAQTCSSVVSTLSTKPKPWFSVVAKPAEEARRVWEPVESQTQRVYPVDFRKVEEISADERRRHEGAYPSEEARRKAEAEQVARQIVADAQDEAKLIREEAYQSAYAEAKRAGHQKGFEEGYTQASIEARNYVVTEFERERGLYRADIEAFLEVIEVERQKAWVKMEVQIVQLTADAVRHIIKIESQENKSLVLATVQNAMRRVAESTTLRIRVNPADLETVRNYRVEILEMLDGIKHLEINEDRRVGQGGCVLETEAGNIDARMETQLQILPDILGVQTNETH